MPVNYFVHNMNKKNPTTLLSIFYYLFFFTFYMPQNLLILTTTTLSDVAGSLKPLLLREFNTVCLKVFRDKL